MSANEPSSETIASATEVAESRPHWWTCWRRLTLWWWLTLGLLLLSPVLGFFATWFAIAVVTMATESGQSKWLRRLLTAPVMIVVVRFAAAMVVGYVAYCRGYWAAEAAIAKGEEQSFAARSFRSMWCIVNDPWSPDYVAWCGWRNGARAALPPHAGNSSYAVQFLTEKGGTIDEDRRVVVLSGDEIVDADLKWLQTFGSHHPMEAVEINCPRVTDDGIRHLRKLHIEQLWLRGGQFSHDVREIVKEIVCRDVWISHETIKVSSERTPHRVTVHMVPDQTAMSQSPSARRFRKPQASTVLPPSKPAAQPRQASASLTRRQFKTLSPEERVVRKWHKDQVRAVALSRDGKQVASGGDDRCVKVWNVTTRRVVWSQEAHASEVTSTWFSDDGSEVLSLSRDGELIVWNAKSGERLRSQKFGDGNGRGMISALSPNGEFLALLGGHPHRLRVWQVAADDHSLLFELDPKFSHPESLAVSPDGSLVAMSSGRTQLIELKTGQVHNVEARGHQRAVNFTPDGLTLATSPGPVELFGLGTLHRWREIPSHASWVRGINFSSNSQDVVFGHDRGRITIGLNFGETWTHLGAEDLDVAATRF